VAYEPYTCAILANCGALIKFTITANLIREILFIGKNKSMVF